MNAGGVDRDTLRRERRRILRKAVLYTYAFLVAAIVIAVAGAAFVAWILSFAGLPLRKTWLVLTVVIIVVPVIGQIVAALRRKAGGDGPPHAGGAEPGA